jgi:hypothetical protein
MQADQSKRRDHDLLLASASRSPQSWYRTSLPFIWLARTDREAPNQAGQAPMAACPSSKRDAHAGTRGNITMSASIATLESADRNGDVAIFPQNLMLGADELRKTHAYSILLPLLK